MNICICRTKVTKREMITFVNYVTYVDKVNLLINDITNAFISMYEMHLTQTNTFNFIFRETPALQIPLIIKA